MGQVAEDLYRSSFDDQVRARWRHRAGELLDDLDARACAQWSDVISEGFDQRLRHTIGLLDDWRDAPDDVGLANSVHHAINALKQHLDAPVHKQRIVTCEMVARIIRRRSMRLTDTGSLVDVARAYRSDGSWFDLARTVVSRGSADPALDTLSRTLADQADHQRQEQGPALASVLAKASLPLPAELVGVEDALTAVVAPLAGERPVLLVVLDGMGLPTFNEFSAELTAANWSPVVAPGVHVAPGVATLPTITEVSRTSLLAGTVRTGDGDSEKRAFGAHPALLQTCVANKPPVLFHKRDLRIGGLDTTPADALDAIADTSRRVVGVVLNNIDERLKDVVIPVEGWNLAELNPLRDLLAEARRAGRAVVLTADHGHVLDRDAEHRAGGGGGERWRPALDNDHATDEKPVTGPRIGTGDGSIIVPFAEQVRYSARRNGYHGGLTPQELFVPLVVLVTDDLDGWDAAPYGPPTWWHHRSAPIAAAPAATRPATSKPPTSATAPTLFDEIAEPEPDRDISGALLPPLVADLLSSDLFTAQLANPRVRVSVDQIAPVLARLAEGTPVADEEISALTGLAAARVGRFVAQLQELLNVEGYPVVRADAGEVRLDIAILTRQFDL